MERLAGVEELLDGALDDRSALTGNLRDLARANRRLGGIDLSARAVEALAPGRAAIRVLDVGTGGADIPLALIGGLVAVALSRDSLSVASLVGFITLTGIATRNTIMMISHYLHLMRHEGERFDERMIVRGSLERLVPVLMTALTAGLALIPLVLAHGEPGKEILHPVATVILGGLVSATLLDVVVTPAVFLRYGRKAAEKYLRREAV